MAVIKVQFCIPAQLVNYKVKLDQSKHNGSFLFIYILICARIRGPHHTHTFSTIENDLLLEFRWPSTKLKVKSAKY